MKSLVLTMFCNVLVCGVSCAMETTDHLQKKSDIVYLQEVVPTKKRYSQIGSRDFIQSITSGSAAPVWLEKGHREYFDFRDGLDWSHKAVKEDVDACQKVQKVILPAFLNFYPDDIKVIGLCEFFGVTTKVLEIKISDVKRPEVKVQSTVRPPLSLKNFFIFLCLSSQSGEDSIFEIEDHKTFEESIRRVSTTEK